MTVRELIAHLQTLPQDFEVAYRQCSDSTLMDAEDIYVCLAEEKKVVRHHNMPDRIRDYRSSEYAEPGKKSTMWQSGESPKFVSVVMFPGN